MALKFIDIPKQSAPAASATEPAQPKSPQNPLAHLGLKGKLVQVGGTRTRTKVVKSEMFNTPWAITKAALQSLVAEYIIIADRQDDDDEEEGVPYLLTGDGIACIPMLGPLTRKVSWRGMAYNEITAMVGHALANDDVKGVLLCVDSPGGEVSGMFETCDTLYQMRGVKPMAAISDDQCYSAAYCLASAADKLFVVPTGGVGSIGCWTAHVDYSQMLKNEGIKVTYIFSGAKKVDGNSTEPLSADAKDEMQEEVDRIRGMFVNAVARNRAVSADALYQTEAGIFMAEKGIPLLADNLGGVDDAINYLRGRIGADDNLPLPEENDDIGVLALGNGYPITLTSPGGKFSLTYIPDVTPSYTFTGGGMQAGAIPYSKTETSDAAWDGPKAKANLKNDQKASYYRRAFAWQQGGSDGTKKNQFKFIHHFVDAGGAIGAASTVACSAGIAILNGGRSGTTIPAADRKGVWNHLAGHLRAAGKTPPPLKSEAEIAEILAQLEESDALYVRSVRVGIYTNALAEGVAIYDYAEADSINSFGTPGISLAVRKIPNCLASPASTGHKVKMLVVPYDGSTCQLGGFKERYEPGCFSRGLDNDPRCLFNHDEAMVLGRKSAGTARFWEDSAGVHAEVDAPDTQWANDMLVSMRRGDITQSSAAFWILQQRWEGAGENKTRVVERAVLRDASVIAFAAYAHTSADVQASMDIKRAHLELLRLR